MVQHPFLSLQLDGFGILLEVVEVGLVPLIASCCVLARIFRCSVRSPLTRFTSLLYLAHSVIANLFKSLQSIAYMLFACELKTNSETGAVFHGLNTGEDQLCLENGDGMKIPDLHPVCSWAEKDEQHHLSRQYDLSARPTWEAGRGTPISSPQASQEASS